MNRSFAGNVRELENIVERAAVSSGNSSLILPEYFSGAAESVEKNEPFRDFLNLPFKEAVARLEKILIENALDETGGNRSEAARKLGINRRLLYDKIAEHKISRDS